MPTNQTVLWEEVWKRTPNTKHFYLADGSKQAVIFSGAVHYKDENGHYQNIDTGLKDEADFDSWDFPVNKHGKAEFAAAKGLAIAAKKANNLNRDLFDYQGLKVPFQAKIPRVFNRGYSIGKGTEKLTFKPIGVSPAKGYVSLDKDNEIIYQDPWNDTDVALELTENGIKETITLKTSKSPTIFIFKVSGDIEGELKLQPAWLKDAEGTTRNVTQTIRQEVDGDYLDVIADVTVDSSHPLVFLYAFKVSPKFPPVSTP